MPKTLQHLALTALSACAATTMACVFIPPPPLAEEVEAARVAKAQAQEAALAAAPQQRPTTGAGPESGGGESTTEPDEVRVTFSKGDPPRLGMTPAEIKAFNGAQGDPMAQNPPTLEQALANVEGEGTLYAEFVTPRGAIRCELFEAQAPDTVANFIALAKGMRPVLDKESDTWSAKPYYDASTFHRVIPGFMIQGGDPTGTGFGNPGYVIDDEFDPDLRHDRPGVLSMANRGPTTGSAQFFITLGPSPHLDGKHTVFGQCDEDSTDIADDIALVPRDENDRPMDPEVLETVRIVRD